MDLVFFILTLLALAFISVATNRNIEVYGDEILKELRSRKDDQSK